MNEQPLIGVLIKSERKRLNLTLDQLGSIAETSKRTAINWEKDLTYPDAKQLRKMNSSGFNTNLIVTGEKVTEKLLNDESALVHAYRNASPIIKEAAINVLMTEPITVTDRITVEEDERFCEDLDRYKITGVTQVYSNSEGREVNRVMVPAADYDAHKADTNNVLSTYNQLSEASQKRLAEDIQNAFIREQQEAALNQILEGNQVEDPVAKKPRL